MQDSQGIHKTVRRERERPAEGDVVVAEGGNHHLPVLLEYDSQNRTSDSQGTDTTVMASPGAS